MADYGREIMGKHTNIAYGKAVGDKQYVTGETKQSILECRAAYHEMTDKEFARWYERRYRIKEKAVMAVLIAQYREAT